MADAFTPKFADLVRNTTTTVGTGSFVLGPPVNGFTGFLAALQPGDSFYYSAIGVDKPAEREIGRGTLQSNGTISRQPIAGVATNFTTGTKTVALVAAAEWFANVQSASAAGGGGQASAATRQELARLSPGSQAAMLREKGREGLFVFEAGDRSATVARDPAQGLCVAPESAPGGASGAWVRKFDNMVNVKWFGAAGDGTTNDHAAFAAAIAALPDDGGTLYIPAGKYRLGGTLHIVKPIRMTGEGIGQNPGIVDGVSYSWADTYHGTRLIFDDNLEGIVFHPHTTEDEATIVAADLQANFTERSAYRSSIEDLMILSAGYAGATRAFSDGKHGLRTKTAIQASRVWVAGFQGNGWEVSATPGATPGYEANYGNADQSQFQACHAICCGNDGFHIDGADAQVMTFIGCDSSLNGGWGFNDEGFLGNSYIGCHAMANNQSLRANAASAIGSFRCEGPVATSVYAGCYIENPTSGEITRLSSACIVIGGVMASERYYDDTNQALVLGGSGVVSGNLGARNTLGDSDVKSGLGRDPSFTAANVAMWWGAAEESAGMDGWRLKYDNANNRWIVEFANGGSGATPIQYASQGSNWRTDTVYAPSFPQGIFLGDNGTGPRIHYGAAEPAAGNWIVGDFVLNSSAAGPLGWRCVAAGSPGTWLPVHSAPPVTSQAGIAYTAVLADAGSYVRFTNGSPVTFTIPPNSAVAFPVGTVIEMEQAGAGALTLAAGAGVTINSRAGDLTLAGQYAVAAIKKVAADSWTLTGDL